MKRIISVVSILLFLLLVTSSTADQITSFLKENYTPLDLNNMDISLMAEDLNDCDVFLSGAEWHGTAASYDLQYALLTTLHKEADVRYLLLGIGHANAQMYNMYLENGDQELLDLILSGIKYSNSSNLEHRLFWEELYKFNQALPAEDRITVIGVNMEYQVQTAIHYLNALSTSDQALIPYPRGSMETPEAIDNYVKTLEQHFHANEALYRQSFGDNFSEYEIVIANIAETASSNMSEDYYALREEIYYKNFLRAYSNNPSGKYFGSFSMEHVYQRPTGTEKLAGVKQFATYLVGDDSPVQDKVVTIAGMYVDSIFRFFYNRYYTLEISQDIYNNDLVFKELSETDYTLFRLTGKNSPFNRSTSTVRYHQGGATTDYYQYILVIKDSPSTKANKR